MYWGQKIIKEMKRIKRALDPKGRLGRGILWDP